MAPPVNIKIGPRDSINPEEYEDPTFRLIYGLGDCINQVLYLESNIDRPYNILCPEPSLTLIKFILDKFITTQPKVRKIISVTADWYGSLDKEKNVPLKNCLTNHNKIQKHFGPSSTELPDNYDLSLIYQYHNQTNKHSKSINQQYVANFSNYL